MKPYAQRNMYNVSVTKLKLNDDGKGPFIGAVIELQLKGEDQDLGPMAKIELGVPFSQSESVAILRERAIELAHALISRFASEPLDEIKRLSTESQLEKIQKDSEEKSKAWAAALQESLSSFHPTGDVQD